MDRNRLWIIGSVMLMVIVVIAGWLLGVQPQLAATATANQDRVKVESQNIANEAVLAKLKQDYASIDGLKARLAVLRAAVPAQAEASAFVTELNGLAGAHQVTLTSISVGDASPYTPPPPSAKPAPTPTPTTGATTGATTGTTTGTTTGAAVAGTNPEITAANFIVIPVKLTITGAYGQVLDFVYGLQTGPRLFLVTTLSSSLSASAAGGPGGGKGAAPGTVDSTIGGFMYVLLNKGGTASAGTGG